MQLFRSGWADEPEISDLIVSFDAESLQRLPVRRQDVVARFLALGNKEAAAVVQRMPAEDGILSTAYVDRLLITVHGELQRMSEEFVHGQRVLEALTPVLAALRRSGVPDPIRIVDIGCGTGYVMRWLAACGHLGEQTQLVGADYNQALVEEARRLAALEGLQVSFVVANAFRLEEPGTIFMSTGFLHHLRGQGLHHVFGEHERSSASAFLHFDFQPSWLAGPGAWLFHAVRMRLPLSKHDGVLSALRAHSASTLLGAVRAAAPGFAAGLYGVTLGKTPLPRSFHTLLGIRQAYKAALFEELGPRCSRLQGMR